MPIYEYEAEEPSAGCSSCSRRIEVLQGLGEAPLTACPACGGKVRKVVSWCRAAVVERTDEDVQVERQVQNYESEGMWSHAAELADKHSEKTEDTSLKSRALDNYKKAGYNVDKLTSAKKE
jgi:putative FmdB family regulatory protein